MADVFGPAGRGAVEENLETIRSEHNVDFCVVNGENAADGVGITARIARRLFEAGADVVTTGNHAFRQKGSEPAYDELDYLLRPANLAAPGVPGRGTTVATSADGVEVAVINLQGALFMTTPTSPFLVVDGLVDDALARTSVVLVDFHAEATSEKIALAQHLDGRASAVIGTHTHVQTNDARVLKGGTAALTDAGMCGPHESVIGVESELAIRRMRTGMPVRFRPADQGVRLEGALIVVDPTSGRASSCETFRHPA
ncbi:MAG: TIGR00282 family metallophosphoesterase [Gaiellaceae bacterium]